MKIRLLIIIALLISLFVKAQVGINNTDPKASLDISATNLAAPANTDGVLIPRVDNFPTIVPTAAQDGMMVFVTGNGTPIKGFYFWDNATASWTTLSMSDADWYKTGGIPSNDINDNIYTYGSVSIGTTSSSYPLTISHYGTKQIGLNINYNYTGTTIPPSGLSIKSQSSGMSDAIFGAYIQVSGSSNAIYSTAINAFNTANATSNYGISARAIGSGTSNYGISAYASGGSTNNWAGYFGFFTNGDGNVYIKDLLHVNGNLKFPFGAVSGYVLSTDAFGNASWVNSSSVFTNIDDQQIDLLSLTGSTLEISLQDDGVIPATVDLSPLRDADWHETGGTPPNNINDNIYTYGNVAIGSSSASVRLDVSDSQAGDYVARINNSSTGASADGLKIRLARTTPGSSNYYIGFYSSIGTERGSISGNSGTGGVNYNTTSDRRLKTKIVSIENALDLISNIQPRNYEYKANLGTKEYGFIAQELQLVYPQAVTGSSDADVTTNPMMVDYSRLTPILTAGIKELDKKVTSQQKDIALLKEENKLLKQELLKLQELEKRLSSIENKMNTVTIEQ